MPLRQLFLEQLPKSGRSVEYGRSDTEVAGYKPDISDDIVA